MQVAGVCVLTEPAPDRFAVIGEGEEITRRLEYPVTRCEEKVTVRHLVGPSERVRVEHRRSHLTLPAR